MSRKSIVAIVVAVVVGSLLVYLYGGHQTPIGQPALAELRPENVNTLANAFNDAKDNVRVLLLLSPT
jgi:hypothetical protein